MTQVLHKLNRSLLLERLLVVVLLWSGPVPVAHCHADVGGTFSASAELCQHLASQHGCLSSGHSDPTGWHIHWILRSEVFDGINCEELILQTECAAETNNCNESPATELQLALDGDAIAPDHGRWAIRDDLRRSFQLVGLLQSRRSLPELLGVMRC